MLASEMEIEKLMAIESHHIPQSFGCMIESKQHGRIFYTSDTGFCGNVLEFAQNCKLLITEATLIAGAEERAN